MARHEIFKEPESIPPKVDRFWDDENVLPPVLSRDTEFVFSEMTRKTLHAAQPVGGKRVLDLGCGRGRDALAMARQGGILYGGEPSQVMLARARQEIRKARVPVILVCHAAEAIPFRNHSFARLICKGALDHFGNPAPALSEMHRVIHPGGKIILSVANLGSLSARGGRWINHLSRRFFRREIPPPHMWKIPKDHLHSFDFFTLGDLVRPYFSIESLRGVSLFWGFPGWTHTVGHLPWPVALILLRLFNTIALILPGCSDVLILSGRPLWEGACGERRSTMNDTSKIWGVVLCAAIIIVAILFLWGISIQSYWALAIPVAAGFLGILGLGFWIGWTILTIKTAPPTPEGSSSSGSNPKESSQSSTPS